MKVFLTTLDFNSYTKQYILVFNLRMALNFFVFVYHPFEVINYAIRNSERL